MTDAGVEFLLENLKQLLVYNVHLISDAKEQVGLLCDDLRGLAAYVKDMTEKRSKYATVKELLRRIRVVVYEAEDVIDTYVVCTAVHKARSTLEKTFRGIDHPLKIRDVAKRIQSIREKVKGITDNKLYGFEALQIEESLSESGSSRIKLPIDVEEDNVVGLDVEAGNLVSQLLAPADELNVISVVGMGGLGKTTLVKKVFNDPSIKYEYFRAWVSVSEKYSRKNVFLGILNGVSQVTSDMYNMTEEMLCNELRKHLESGKYLIVLDDVWEKDAWDSIKMAIPKTNNEIRVILTTRITEVGEHANPDIEPYKLRFLTDDESWELLRMKAFRKRSCPMDLEVVGKEIARQCFGLPLAIVVIAGILRNQEKTSAFGIWEKVAKRVSSYIAMKPEECNDVLALSYEHLPYDLKSCFLYFGVFPEDFEIPVWKLIHIWVAEGFIQPVADVCLEDIAEGKLLDLVDRNLVLVEKRRSNGGIKTCRVHDLLRELCAKEAEEELFFKEIKWPPVSSPATPNVFRRLCIHSHVEEHICSKPCSQNVRSFLCFALEEMFLALKYISVIPEAFVLLRVLDIRPISFPRFPSAIINLVHLRYMALSGTFTILPDTTSKLSNLQTVIVETEPHDALVIKADIWKMFHLRHLYTRRPTILPSPSIKARKGDKNPFVNGNMQTISTLSPQSCSVNILARTPNLKKLGIRGNLVTLMEEIEGSSRFDCLAKQEHLETLKLCNDAFPDRPPKLSGLPQWYKFPPKLKKLSISHTLLDWNHMSVLGMLRDLEVLKLGENAFEGGVWKTLDGGFVRLKVFQLEKTDLIHWEASACHFPRLQRLIMKKCQYLEKIPSGLGEVSALQLMDLSFITSSAAASARLIEDQKKQSGVTGFKLHIYPPDQ